MATIFAGNPGAHLGLTEWDRAAGYTRSSAAVSARREEDAQALGLLGAAPRWLDFLDSQYAAVRPPVGAIADRLQDVLHQVQARSLFMPLGLFHSDHALARAAGLELLRREPALRAYAYEDSLYRRMPGLRTQALEQLREQGVRATPASFAEHPAAAARKRAAVACYRSQLRALATPGRPGHADTESPEAYWSLDRSVDAQQGERAKLGIVVLTHQRCEEVLRTLGEIASGNPGYPVCVVDNGSDDATAAMVAQRFPETALVRLPRNQGAAGRNHGVARLDADYIAFCDDDTWWEPGALAHAVRLFDAFPRLAAVTARVVVGAAGKEDPTCSAMARSGLACHADAPGWAAVGFLAGACVMRRRAFLQAGGYEPRLFLGGEESLLALDLMAAGWRLSYCPELVVHHHPSPRRDTLARRRLLLRNALWCAWLRRPRASMWRHTVRGFARAVADPRVVPAVFEALAGLPWVLAHRRVVPGHVEAALRQLEAGVAP